MSILSRAARYVKIALAAESPLPGVIPPSRAAAVTAVSPDAALTLSTVYRAVQIHGTAASQMRLFVKRAGLRMNPTPAQILQPDINQPTSAFIEYSVNCMALTGNAFWILTRSVINDQVINRTPVNPHEVTVTEHPDTRVPIYHYRGVEYSPKTMRHLKLMRVPGWLIGLGPIQAAQVELRGAIAARDYGSLWLDEANVPDGILTTDLELTGNQSQQYKNIWYGRKPNGDPQEEGTNPRERLRVLGQGLHYEHLMLKPADLQFLETQQFTTTQLARLFAVPSSLMLAAVEGGGQTYSNIEQDWIGYVRFGLMGYLREIEEALAVDLPRGQEVEFSVEDLYRTDTKTRYEAHNMALTGKWKTDDEVRAEEGLAPLTTAQRAQLTPAPTPPAPTEENAA